MTVDQVVFESVKLVAQLLGAVVVTRLAVGWALSRYKAEKAWERRLAAYVDAVSALSEMRLVVGRWIDEIEQHRDSSAETAAKQRERYQLAHRQLEQGVAAAQLLVPGESADLLARLDTEIARARRGQNQHDDLDAEYDILSGALDRVIELGRVTLGPELRA